MLAESREKKKNSAREILVLAALSSNKGSGESTQMRRLARAFAARIQK